MIRLLFALFLNSCAILIVSGKPIEKDTTNNGQKGQIWKVAASFIQKAHKFSSKAPGPRRADKEFEKWISNFNDNTKVSVRNLRESVNDFRASTLIKGEKRKKSTPKELAVAIVTVINKSPGQYISPDSASVLRTEFDNILEQSSSKHKTDSKQVAESSLNQGDIQDKALEKVSKPIGAPSPPNEGADDSSNSRILTGVLVGVFSFFLGIVVCMAYIKFRQGSRHSEPTPDKQIPERDSEKLKIQLRDAESHNIRLRHQIEALHGKANIAQNTNSELVPQIDAAGGTDYSRGNIIEPTILPVETTGIILPKDSSLPSSTFRYAAALNDGYIEDKRISDTGKERFAIKICISSSNKDRATFTLNPDVNQNWLIETGLERLRSYFDFTLKVGRPESVSAAGNGELVRQGEGWQVTTPAKLTIR